MVCKQYSKSKILLSWKFTEFTVNKCRNQQRGWLLQFKIVLKCCYWSNDQSIIYKENSNLSTDCSNPLITAVIFKQIIKRFLTWIKDYLNVDLTNSRKNIQTKTNAKRGRSESRLKWKTLETVIRTKGLNLWQPKVRSTF